MLTHFGTPASSFSGCASSSASASASVARRRRARGQQERPLAGLGHAVLLGVSSPVHVFQPCGAEHLGARLPHRQDGRDLLPGEPLVAAGQREVQRRQDEGGALVADLLAEEAEVHDVVT
jgi:hypothetical protein